MTNATNNVARVAAAVAGFGLVAMSFAPLAGAQTTTTTTTTTTATFSRDLTIGSTGADVTALQNWLIGKGYAIAAGATGYFGAQTKAALASYQAANMITPAAGYFGPITRAKVMAAGGSTGSTGGSTGGSSTGGLSGGEANLTDFDLRSEDSEGNEGEEMVEIATAEFDVEDGDIEIDRVEFEFDATNGSLEDQPWQYFDTLYIVVDGDEIGEVDASDRDEWDETNDDIYEIQFTGLDYVVEEDDMASLTLVADIASNIDESDLAQEFAVAVLDEGIRGVDSEGVQQYIGDGTRGGAADDVEFGFGEEENGDLSIRESDSDPDATTLKVEDDEASDEYTVFVFEIRNTEDVDSLITELTIDTTISGSTTTDDVIRNATLVVDGDEFDGDIEAANDGNLTFEDIDVVVGADETVEFELVVEFTAADNDSFATGDTIAFDIAPADIEAEGDESGDSIETADIGGGATSETHTLALTGFGVEAVSATADADNEETAANSTGTFTIKFDVTADEDDPVYVDNLAHNATSSSAAIAGATYNVFRNGVAATAPYTSENAVLTSTADMESGAYRVNAGDTETFTLTVTIDPTVSGLYALELEAVNYASSAARATSGTASENDTFSVDNNNSDFETDPVNVQN